MAFPDSSRVIYDNNPLEEVICQAKFPAVLKISESPIEFQEEIRQLFPLFEQKPAIGLPVNVFPEIARMLSANSGTVYQFHSRDKVWTLSLFRDFLALSCSRYRQWEEFRDRFAVAFTALNNIYSPAFFLRVGLRYRNIIDRTKLGLGDRPWSDLLRGEICGELAAAEIRNSIEQATREVVFRMGENQKVRLVHGLIEGGESYVIDADFFIESEVDIADVSAQLNSFNHESGRLFRWAITETLHSAMRPVTV